MDSHLCKFFYHSGRVRPIRLIELPITLLWPVEVVAHNHRQRNPSFFIFLRYWKQFLLSFVSEFWLPESGCPLRKFRGKSCETTIAVFYLPRIVSHDYQIINLSRRFCHPPGLRCAKFHPPNSRIIPYKSISFWRKDERNRALCILLA